MPGNQVQLHSHSFIRLDICLMDPDAGKCPDSTKANGQIWYFFNSETGLCENFLYHGCAAGNQNRFYSLYQCKKICGERFDPQIGLFCDNLSFYPLQPVRIVTFGRRFARQ